jgi:predicted ATPase
MLTRIEIDGFKSFEQFSLDLAPFLVILGPNASGKSNLFEALQFLSFAAQLELRGAVKHVRGEPYELFRRQPDGTPGSRMAFAAELLLPRQVHDRWGNEVQIAHTRVRYELEIERRKHLRGIERLLVAREEARPIVAGEDWWQPGAQRPGDAFRKAFVRYSREQPWLTTPESTNEYTDFEIHADTVRGTQRIRVADGAESTMLSSIITAREYPHLYAVREELSSWHLLHLDPAAMRRPSPTTAAAELEPNGRNLAAVLARIQAETQSDVHPQGTLADIAANLTSLIPGVLGLEIAKDSTLGEYQILISMRDGPAESSRVVSDGTLRVLAVLTLLYDPRFRGLISIEEPENGIHPWRLRRLMQRMREAVGDYTSETIDEKQPLFQILLSSHSPVVLSSVGPGESVFADVVSRVNPTARTVTRRTRMRPVCGNGQAPRDPETPCVSKFEVDQYLSSADTEA